MSNVDIERTLENIVNPDQNRLETCPQKAQTEESVNHAKKKRKEGFFCARKQNSSSDSRHNTADCNCTFATQRHHDSAEYCARVSRLVIYYKDFRSNLIATNVTSTCTFAIFTVSKGVRGPSGFQPAYVNELNNPVYQTKKLSPPARSHPVFRLISPKMAAVVTNRPHVHIHSPFSLVKFLCNTFQVYC